MFRLSIIIPVFKVEQYIRRCLESVFTQADDIKDNQLECILVDDCSPDKSMAIAKEVIQQYDGHYNLHIRCMRHEVNRGLSSARNTGLEHATGEYILFIDSDDYLLPGSLSVIYQSVNTFPQADMLIPNVFFKTDKRYIHHHTTPTLIADKAVIVGLILRKNLLAYAWNRIIRRAIITENNVRFPEGIVFEDQIWSYQLSLHLKSVAFLPEATYFYNYNPKGITATANSEESAMKTAYSYQVIAEFFLNHKPERSIQNNLDVDRLMFVYDSIIKGYYALLQTSNFGIKKSMFSNVRRELMKQAISKGRLVLTCFFLTTYGPCIKLLNTRWYRKNNYYIRKVVRYLAS